MEHLRGTNVVFAIVMALLVVQSSTRPQPEEIDELKKTLYNTCSGKFPITEEHKNKLTNSEIIDDPNLKCFFKCVLEELSLIDEDGIIDGESLVSMASDNVKSTVQQAVSSCQTDVKEDGCEAAFKFFSCGIKINSKTTRPQPDELEELSKTLYTTCSGKFPISEEIKNKLKNSEVADDPNLKVSGLNRCNIIRNITIDEDGIIDGESLISMAADHFKPIVQQAVSSCQTDYMSASGQLDAIQTYAREAFNMMKMVYSTEQFDYR
ncbi:hypothetical protein ACI65C_002589 [Semiaphis heraclei]